ncbi:MAG TPA: outer membrane beta-barrel protein [Edaphobacter sp.]|nr:outer membrane beta-barrel protein [Edaphobacter sp.]
MGLFSKISTSLLVFSAASFAQFLGPLSIGAKVGVPITDAFSTTSLGPNQTLYSNSQNYILGPSIELRLPYRLSVEFDALYRPLTFGTSTASVVNGSPVLTRTSTDLSSWEFPLMFKYHFATEHRIRPYIEVGPSFRTGARQLNYLSDNGVTAGLGTDLKALGIRLSPEFRYTHWAGDSVHTAFNAPLASRQDQVEFLFGISF